MTTHHVAVIGAGASGSLLTVHLLRQAPPGTRITLIERNAPFGPGLAFATGHRNHVLNVPAGRMSAFADRPRHFVDWLERQPEQILDGAQPSETGFMPRRLYGAYLRHLLNTAAHDAALDTLHDSVVAVAADGPPTLDLASGRSIPADMVVLATGNDQPAVPGHIPGLCEAPQWRPDPWSPTAFATLDPRAAVLLIGTGLTMVDAVVTLLDQGHRGPIHAVSRRGLLPRPHAPAGPPRSLPPLPTCLGALTRLVRAEAEQAGDAWRGVIDALRPATQAAWQALTIEERGRFLRHLRPWWDVHRHRTPQAIAERIDAARAAGQLQVHAGRITGCATAGAALDLRLRRRDGTTGTLRVARVVNCTGPCTDVTRSADPLLRALLQDGLVQPDSCHLGLQTTDAGAVVGRDGEASTTLFALGPLTRGMFWEVTAIPDIRRQCEALAQHLAHVMSEPARERRGRLAYA
ncbi:MAG: FAD/NAD(P)-binding protein [Acetobacteraceae bacterium]